MSGQDTIDAAWRVGIFDAHCHPTDIMSALDRIGDMKANALTVMATRAQDQHLVEIAAEKYPLSARQSLNDDNAGQVIPSFGWHPWFAHQIYDDRELKENIDAVQHYTSVLTPTPTKDDESFLRSLPTPRPLTEYIQQSEQRLQKFPVALVGEIGLDRSFRVPYGSENEPGDVSIKTGGPEEGEYTPGSREGRPLTSFRVRMEHQKLVLKAQLELAARLKRPVSVHSVQAHGVVFEVLQELWKGYEIPSKRSQRKKDAPNTHDMSEDNEKDENEPTPFPPRICMHSYSGPVEALKQYLNLSVPADIFFSFSALINFNPPTVRKASDVIKAVPNHNILVESDLHCAGDQMDDLLGQVVTKVCEIKGWTFKQGAQQLKSNWERFVFGSQQATDP